MDFTTTITAAALVVSLVNVITIFGLKSRLEQSIKHEYSQYLEYLTKALEFDLNEMKRVHECKLAQYKKCV